MRHTLVSALAWSQLMVSMISLVDSVTFALSTATKHLKAAQVHMYMFA